MVKVFLEKNDGDDGMTIQSNAFNKMIDKISIESFHLRDRW